MRTIPGVLTLIVLLPLLARAADEPKQVSSHTYEVKPLFKAIYPANAGDEDRPLRSGDEPIGFSRTDANVGEATDMISHLMTAHLEPGAWANVGGDIAEMPKAEGGAIEVRAPESMHKGIEGLFNAIAKPAKFNPKATADELTAAAVYVSNDRKTITLVYGLSPFPARVCGKGVSRTSRVQVIGALVERIYDNVTPGKWLHKGHDLGLISELAGRLIVTAPPETHVELAQKMQEWTKR